MGCSASKTSPVDAPRGSPRQIAGVAAPAAPNDVTETSAPTVAAAKLALIKALDMALDSSESESQARLISCAGPGIGRSRIVRTSIVPLY